MAKIRNVSGEPLYVPGAGHIAAGAVVDMADALVYSLTASANYEPADKATQKLHDDAAQAEAKALAAEDAARRPAAQAEPEPAGD